jgi:enoyl-CoA hydratase/carnithine racemase
MTEPLRIEIVDHVATVTIDHPPINLFDLALYPAMMEAAIRLEADDDVRVVVLRSALPEFFIAHFDVSLIQMMPTAAPPLTELHDFHQMVERFRTMGKATIAVIEGRIGGGGSELALSCDLRFAAPTARFNQPEVALGIIPGGSGTQQLARLIGRSRALEVILGCDDIDAATAERWGWVNRVLDDDVRWPFVDRLARRIASFPPHAVQAAKQLVHRATDADTPQDLLVEANTFMGTLGHSDTQRALANFLARGGQSVAGELAIAQTVEALAD